MESQESGTIRPTVLVAHDDVDRADRFADCLPREYTVRTANTRAAALALLSGDIDVVVINQSLGKATGESVFETARANGFEGRGVLLTDARPDLEHVVEKFDDYLVKPVSRTDVRDTVEHMLDRTAYDAGLKDVLVLASRMATLESKLSIDELRTSAAYERLDARLEEYRKHGLELGALDGGEYAEFSSDKLRVVLG